jgi:hypothetical protein
VRTAGVDDAIANGVELMPNQPNPFSRGTTLAFRLPAPARVRLGVYDVAGREVARLVDERRAAGVHHVELDGRTLSAGVYFCKLEVAGRLHQRRAILIR